MPWPLSRTCCFVCRSGRRCAQCHGRFQEHVVLSAGRAGGARSAMAAFKNMLFCLQVGQEVRAVPWPLSRTCCFVCRSGRRCAQCHGRFQEHVVLSAGRAGGARSAMAAFKNMLFCLQVGQEVRAVPWPLSRTCCFVCRSGRRCAQCHGRFQEHVVLSAGRAGGARSAMAAFKNMLFCLQVGQEVRAVPWPLSRTWMQQMDQPADGLSKRSLHRGSCITRQCFLFVLLSCCFSCFLNRF